MTKEEYINNYCDRCQQLSNSKCRILEFDGWNKCVVANHMGDAWDAAQKATIERAWEWIQKRIRLIGSQMELHGEFRKAMEESNEEKLSI